MWDLGGRALPTHPGRLPACLPPLVLPACLPACHLTGGWELTVGGAGAAQGSEQVPRNSPLEAAQGCLPAQVLGIRTPGGGRTGLCPTCAMCG